MGTKRKMKDARWVCEELGMDFDEVWNVYPYGSHVYGNATEDSDEDFVVVFKRSILKSGAFKDNAVSNEDRTVQGSAFSRGGFQDAINNYNMTALECVFLPKDMVLKETKDYKIEKYMERDMVKKVVTQASNSWHIAYRRWIMQRKVDELEPYLDQIKRGLWHSLRILTFGLQMKERQEIYDYASANSYKKEIVQDADFHPDKYEKVRDELIERLRS